MTKERLRSLAIQSANEGGNATTILNDDLINLLDRLERYERALTAFAKINIDFIAKGEPFRELILNAREALEE